MKLLSPEVVAWGNVEAGHDNPADVLYDYRILAEGDSWFSIGGFPVSNLLLSMRTDGYAIIVNCARPGDTIRHMARITRNPNLKKALSRRHGYTWDALLLSGGGNDLIDDVPKIIRPFTGYREDPAAYCDQEALGRTLASVADGYRRIVHLRDAPASSCRGCPVITHTYDWLTPRNAPARFLPFKVKGPWLYPALLAARYPRSEWNPLSDYLVDCLRRTIAGLARGRDRLPNFHVVTTQDTITPAALDEPGVSGDWQNEIHPTHAGYRLLARKIAARLRKALRDG